MAVFLKVCIFSVEQGSAFVNRISACSRISQEKKEAFDEIDFDEQGACDPHELRVILRNFGIRLSPVSREVEDTTKKIHCAR